MGILLGLLGFEGSRHEYYSRWSSAWVEHCRREQWVGLICLLGRGQTCSLIPCIFAFLFFCIFVFAFLQMKQYTGWRQGSSEQVWHDMPARPGADSICHAQSPPTSTIPCCPNFCWWPNLKHSRTFFLHFQFESCPTLIILVIVTVVSCLVPVFLLISSSCYAASSLG